ncbi:MAG: hypothetical protein U0263_36730 [Polyangiaceae bacterium]
MEAFRECGFPAFLVLALGILAVLGGLVALGVAIAKPRAGLVLGVVALALACVVPAAGVGGTLLGRQKTDEAVSGVSIDEGQRERIRIQGYAEASQCTTIGAGAGALPFVLALAALGLAVARRKSAPQNAAGSL